MKIYKLEISTIKEFQNLATIKETVNFFDIGLVLANTNKFTTKDLQNF